MRKKMFYGVLSVLTLGLAACSSNDDFATDASLNKKAEYDQTQYIAVQISAPRDAGTRAVTASDFQDGTADESVVKRLDFLFYDAAGNPTSTPLVLEADNEGKLEGLTESSSDDYDVTKIYTSVVPVALTQGQNFPSQVICIVNGRESVTNLQKITLSQLIGVMRNYFHNDKDGSFLMSNSVYYGQDVLTGRPYQRICATPINTNSQLFGTEEEAKAAITNAATGSNALVDIYVERLAAKVGLTMDADAVNSYKLTNGAGGDDIILTFTPEYWAMNAVDDDIYLTKRYGVEDGEKIDTLPDYTAINKALTNGSFIDWNDAANYRSYWGCSPSYFENSYPDVADDVDDLDGNKAEDDFYSCTYYSYNGIITQANRKSVGKQAIAAVGGAFTMSTTGDVSTGYIYTKETTVAKQRLNDVNNSNPAAAVPSAVLVGRYKVAGAEDATTFYIDRNAGTGGTFYASEAAAKARLIGRQGVVFTKEEGTEVLRRAVDANRFVLEHPTKAVRDKASTKLAGRLVALQIKDLSGTALYYYDITKGDYAQITEDNLAEVNAQLLTAGYMDMFADGLAFFSVPIRHLNWKTDYYKDGKYDWANMASGSVGVVRNHVYNLTIKSVSGLGTALRSVEQPIVPAKEEANQYIAARLNILAWRIANSWEVSL